MNPNVIKMEYAVRGPLVIRAGEIEKEIKQVKPNKKHLKEINAKKQLRLNHGDVGLFAFICFAGNSGKFRSKIDTSNSIRLQFSWIWKEEEERI